MKLLRNPKSNIFHDVPEGEKALTYLRQAQEDQDATKSDLILFGCESTEKNDHQILEEMKQDERLRDIPVIILSSSGSKDDIVQMYELGAHLYIPKPESLENYNDLVQEIENMWVNLPPLHLSNLARNLI